MKKFVLFVMLMMSVVSVSAQRWSLTPEVGMTAVKRGGSSYIDEPGYTWNARWKIGVGVEYVVKPDRFSLKSGLYYAQRGYSRQSTSFGNIYPTIDDQSESTFSKSYYKTRRHFLQVPLMANLSFRLADNVRLNLAAGPYIAYSMGDKNIAVYNEYTPGNSSSHESWTHDNSFDWGLSFQAGLEIGSCVMNVGYDASLGKEYEYDSVDLKYHTFSLSVGYKFKLGK